ncbi:MAG: glycosyltransferase family 4 protein, partial [Lachnospiraceae bacterium]|nr:glycosyltransferase family 4 protein [Lachnospiraceae bacterium]
MMEKKVLLVLYELTYTGSPKNLLNFVQILKQNNYEIEVWSYNDGPFKEELIKKDIDTRIIEEIDVERGLYRKQIRSYSFIFVYTIFCIDFALKCQSLCQTYLYIMEGHNLTELCKTCSIDEKKISKVENIVCVSQYARDYLKTRYGIQNVRIIHNYIDPVPTKINIHKKLRFIVSGTIEPRKGQDIAVNAIKLLPLDIRKKIELYIVGNAPNWSSEFLKQLQNNSDTNTYYIQEIKDYDLLYKFYNKMDVFLVPSRDESCSIVALEGAMLKKALVVTEHTGAKYLLSDNKKNIITTNDEEALAKVMLDYARHRWKIKKDGIKAYQNYKKMGQIETAEKEFLNTIKEGITMKKEKKYLCAILLDYTDCNNNFKKTIQSINNQVLDENDYIMLFVKDEQNVLDLGII